VSGTILRSAAAGGYSDRVFGRFVRRAFARGALLGCLLAGGCGRDADGAGDAAASDPGGPIPIERLARELAQSACAAADRCEMGAWTSVLRQSGSCVDAFERVLALRFLGSVAAVGSGDLSYDAVAARACVASFAGACPPCGVEQGLEAIVFDDIDPLAWCPHVFGGCVSVVAGESPWTPPVEDGAACGLGGGRCCAAGSVCDLSKGCRPALSEGSTCLGTGCGDGLSCSSVDDAGTDSTCQPFSEDFVQQVTSLVAVARPLGASCLEPDGAFKSFCNAGLACDIETGKCITPKAIGESCDGLDLCAGFCDIAARRCVARGCPSQ